MMLTRKQQFRRQVLKKTNQTRYDHDYIYAEGTSRFNDIAPVRTSSLPSVGTPNTFTQNGRTWNTTGDFNTPNSLSYNHQRLKDKISFNNAVRVVLIPTRDEYRAAGLGDLMWWEDNDYNNFKESALQELRNLVHARGKMDTKTALNILYQLNSNSKQTDDVFETTLTIDVLATDLPPGINGLEKPSVLIVENENDVDFDEEAITSVEVCNEFHKSQEEIKIKITITEDEKSLTSSWKSEHCVAAM